MRFPLVASWMDAGTVDCLWDDNDQNIGDLAYPQAVVLLDLEQPTIDSLLTAALAEYLGAWEDDDYDCPKPSGTWHTDGWKASTGPLCNGNQTWWWGDDEVNPDVVVVARECTTYGGSGGPV